MSWYKYRGLHLAGQQPPLQYEFSPSPAFGRGARGECLLINLRCFLPFEPVHIMLFNVNGAGSMGFLIGFTSQTYDIYHIFGYPYNLNSGYENMQSMV